MSTYYRMMCKECDAISQDIGTNYRFHEPDLVVSFIKKHWNCEKSGIKIVNSEVYGVVDCRVDDCQPNSIPAWDSIFTLTDKGLESEKVWQDKCKERLGIKHEGEFICDCCNESFISKGSQEEMVAEKNELFPGLTKEDAVIVCTDCHIKIMDYNEPGLKRYEKFLTAKGKNENE